MKKKKLLVLTGGGDCPGLNSVIQSIVKSAHYSKNEWEVWGSKKAFNGLLTDPMELVKLDLNKVKDIQSRGGTILETSNSGNPICYPRKKPDGTIEIVDLSEELIQKLKDLEIDVVINIGGDGSQQISQHLFEKGVNIIGVPKTIDNDLAATDLTFGFQTAVETATEAVDKLVTTAQSHNRVMIAEVMGRDAGWICLYTAVAGNADIAIIPEIPYKISAIINKLKTKINHKKEGFAIIVVAEGAKPEGGERVCRECHDLKYQNPLLGGISYQLMKEIQEKMDVEIRVTVLGHTQRGGSPIAFDRVIATQFGAKAFELAEQGKFGEMVSLSRSQIISVKLKDAIAYNKQITNNNYLLKTAQNIGICVGI